MTTYATTADLADRLSWDELAQLGVADGRVTGDLLRRHVVDEEDLTAEGDDVVAALGRAVERIEQVLEHATSEIDARIRGVVSLPLAPVPEVLRVRAVDFAAYELAGGGRDSDHWIRWDAARAWLADVAAGRVSPDLGAADGPAPAASGAAFQGGDSPFFSRARIGRLGPGF